MSKNPLTERQVLSISAILQGLIILAVGWGATKITQTSDTLIRFEGRFDGLETALIEATSDRFRGSDATNMRILFEYKIDNLIEEDQRSIDRDKLIIERLERIEAKLSNGN